MPNTPFSTSTLNLGNETNPIESQHDQRMMDELQNQLKAMGANSLADGLPRPKRSTPESIKPNLTSSRDSFLSKISTADYEARLGEIPPASAKPTEVPIAGGKTRGLRITGGLQRQSRGPERDALQKMIESGGFNPLNGIHVFEQVHVHEESAPHTPSQTELPNSTTAKPTDTTNTVDSEKGEMNRINHRKELDDLFSSKAPANPSLSTPSDAAPSQSTSTSTLMAQFSKIFKKLSGILNVPRPLL